MNPKDFKEEELDKDGAVSLSNEFGEWSVKAEPSDAVASGVIVAYSALWPKLGGGKSANFLTTHFVQKYGRNSAFNSTFVPLS